LFSKARLQINAMAGFEQETTPWINRFFTVRLIQRFVCRPGRRV